MDTPEAQDRQIRLLYEINREVRAQLDRKYEEAPPESKQRYDNAIRKMQEALHRIAFIRDEPKSRALARQTLGIPEDYEMKYEGPGPP
jgi:tRNA C32,U32 (ribose-2'-O)-methylase TrmJ